ncbi:MAG: DUF4178 domain-containing protein [Opitutales bacterium]
MSLIVLVILVGVAGFVIFSLMQSKGGPIAPPPETRAMTIENVDVGGTIMLSGVGPDLEDFDLIVTAKHIYEEDGYLWHELEAEKGAKKVWITVENDDELELSITVSKHKLRDAGLTPEQLDQFKKDDDGSFSLDDVTYHLEDYGKAIFYRGGNRAQGEKFKYWEFESKDERHYASVEMWGSGEYELHISEPLRSAQIQIFTLKG